MGNAQYKLILTFDDGPVGDDGSKAQSLRQILDTLAQYKAGAAFYVLGTEVKSRPDLARLIASRGHALQNHSWDHARLPTLDEVSLRLDLQRTQDIIFSVTGKTPDRLRPPYGSGMNSPTVKKVADQLGLTLTHWDVDSGDARREDTNVELSPEQCSPDWSKWRGLYDQNGQRALDLLMHVKRETGKNLGRLMSQLKRSGWDFTTYDDAERMSTGGRYYIQLFAGSQARAREIMAGSSTPGYKNLQLVSQAGLYKVHVGPYDSRATAAKFLPALQSMFSGAFIVEVKP